MKLRDFVRALQEGHEKDSHCFDPSICLIGIYGKTEFIDGLSLDVFLGKFTFDEHCVLSLKEKGDCEFPSEDAMNKIFNLNVIGIGVTDSGYIKVLTGAPPKINMRSMD